MKAQKSCTRWVIISVIIFCLVVLAATNLPSLWGMTLILGDFTLTKLNSALLFIIPLCTAFLAKEIIDNAKVKSYIKNSTFLFIAIFLMFGAYVFYVNIIESAEKIIIFESGTDEIVLVESGTEGREKSSVYLKKNALFSKKLGEFSYKSDGLITDYISSVNSEETNILITFTLPNSSIKEMSYDYQ